MVEMHLRPYFLFCFLFFLFFFILPKTVFAEDVAYKVTDPQILPAPSVVGVGRVLFNTNIFVNYAGGKVVVSKNPDGTGGADVGDTVQLINSYPSNRSFTYNGFLGCILRRQMPPTDITYLFVGGANNVLVRYLDWCWGAKSISSLYIVHTLPEPAGPAPFLDLPWDYQGKGLSFSEAALSINSFFDHEYPLLSSGINEESGTQNSVIFYKGGERNFDRDYSSHEGYDYGRIARANNGDSVLASAAGIATYHNSCGACGNAIHIDHGNGYQTRYYHLQSDGLITNVPGQQVQVVAGQPIGKVGATGNVSPPGEGGAHIHFMVLRDKDNDGNFENNIPDGIVDPFGWQSKEKDPWQYYSFLYNGLQKTGSKSYYLWKNKLDSSTSMIDPFGGEVTSNNYSATFVQGSTTENVTVTMQSSPTVSISDILTSLGQSITISAVDIFGEAVTQFASPFTLTVDFSNLDISRFDPSTISLYSTSDGATWTQEQTFIENQTATAQINHLSQFTLAAERKDIEPPTTTATFNTSPINVNQYALGTQLSLSSQDNDGGLGVDYTLYKLDDGDWTTYTTPFTFDALGLHAIEFYSVDNDENIEDKQSISFEIINPDTTPPEVELLFDTGIEDFKVIGTDDIAIESVINEELQPTVHNYTITDTSGNTLKLAAIKDQSKRELHIQINSLQYNNGTSVGIGQNEFSVLYEPEAKKPKNFEQTFTQNEVVKIKLIYNQRTNKTAITVIEKGNDRFVEERSGIVLLKLFTQQGTLRYSY